MHCSCALPEPDSGKDAVICVSTSARQAHENLFRLEPEAYVTLRDGELSEGSRSSTSMSPFHEILEVLASCTTPSGAPPERVQVVLDWEALLHLALWKSGNPRLEEVITLLQGAGMSMNEARLLVRSDPRHAFSALCRGEGLDILRGLCRTAKSRIEAHAGRPGIRADCHIFCAETNQLVASSL